ncbi:amidohydrolase [Streptomyces sp. HPF1205]|uniref:amidohydrolase n=1 Tax=Streptomyces sp. HPF1205 TaxID=2873262 RepID=UPI001CEDE6AF|nr:amidohydrolase [Streptomyces sp. HPF1205]
MAQPGVLFVNARIFRGGENPEYRWIEKGYLAVHPSGWIDCLGEGEPSSTYNNYERIECGGKTLTPGFHDAHVHPIGFGLALTGKTCVLSGVSRDDYKAAVARYQKTNPEGVIVGGGWAMEAFADTGGWPDRRLLDDWIPDGRPAFLQSRDGHSTWFNTAVLKACGLSSNTPDPEGGWFTRDPDGTPAGVAHEWAQRLEPKDPEQFNTKPFTLDELVEALVAAQNQLLYPHGITGWQDALVDHESPPASSADAYAEAKEKNRLTGRASCALTWYCWQNNKIDEQIAGLEKVRDKLQGQGVRADTVKILLDGIVESYTAALNEPYNVPEEQNPVPGGSGVLHVPLHDERDDMLTVIVKKLAEKDFNCHFHAIGDRAVHAALSAVREAKGSGVRPRDKIAHLQVVAPEDISGFNGNAIATIQPIWACHGKQMDTYNIPVIGDKRTLQQYPFRSLIENGAVLAAGSDGPVSMLSGHGNWPTSSVDPIAGIYVAMTRRPPDEEREALAPADQVLSLSDALNAYTYGSAYAAGDDATQGTLDEGKIADLVILNSQLSATSSATDVKATRVWRTYIGGQQVYEAPS